MKSNNQSIGNVSGSVVSNNNVVNDNVNTSDPKNVFEPVKKWVILFSVINFFLFVVCLVLLAVTLPSKCELDFDYYGAIVAVMSVLVTLLMGWNIYSALDLEKTIKQMGLNVQKLEEETASSIENQKQDIEHRFYFLESKSALNMKYAFMHLKGSLMEDKNSKEYHIIYLNYCIVSYGLQELLYSQESKMKECEDNVLDMVLDFLKKETMIVTPVQFHELLDVFHKLNIPDKNKSKELYGLLTSINVSGQSE